MFLVMTFGLTVEPVSLNETFFGDITDISVKQTIFDDAFKVKPSQLSVLVDLQRIFLNEDLTVGGKELFFCSFCRFAGY